MYAVVKDKKNQNIFVELQTEIKGCAIEYHGKVLHV